MLKIMVTGVGGFVGKHLARELHQAGYSVYGVGRAPNTDPELKPLMQSYFECDLTKEKAVAELPLAKMDAIINLAGLANVGASYDQADLYIKVNTSILKNLADRCLSLKLTKLRFIVVSTGTVYEPNQNPPMSEDAALTPPERHNPYIASKVKQEEMAAAYRKKGLDCIVARPFNHIGPGQLPGFLVPDLAQQLAQVRDAGLSEIKVGDLSKERDFTDVRDVVRAYRLLVSASPDQLKQSTYNICSGQPHKGEELLQLLIDRMGLNEIKVSVDPSRLRPNDPQSVYGSAASLKRDTGWELTIPLKQTITDFVAWYQAQQ